ncbi:MAG TPA: oligosaccharide flippase family protein [Rugosimonospora sp.]|nr:oligosaccharide flippase family protein [Rugosimonospora sp.]
MEPVEAGTATRDARVETEVIQEIHSIGRKAGRGLGWGLLGNAGAKIGSFATALVMARLLVPHDFGTYAVALAATQFVIHINDLGLIPATIQWRGRLEEMAPTAATIAGGFSALVYVVFWFAAPPFAHLSGVPGATPVIRLFTITILIDGFTAVRSAYLLRTFQQKRYVLANTAGIAANGVVAISLAVTGGGAMALAAGQVASSVTTGVLVFVWAGLPIRVGINLAIARRLMAYGLPLTLGLAVEAVIEQADKVVVGRVMGATVLGFYLLAFSISSWAPGMIGSAIRFVSLPGFARLSEKDSDTLSGGVQRAIPLMVLGLVPIAVLVAVLAEPTIAFLYGPKWMPAAGPLRFLMILMIVRMLTGIAMDILMSTGATRWTLLINIGWALTLIPALWAGTKANGAQGAAIAEAVIGMLIAMPLAVVALERAGVRLGPIAPRLVRPLFAGVVCAAVAVLLHLVAGHNAFIQLATAGTAGLLAYLVVAVPRTELRGWLAALRARRAGAMAE